MQLYYYKNVKIKFDYHEIPAEFLKNICSNLYSNLAILYYSKYPKGALNISYSYKLLLICMV